jgi:hypothetical protein
MGPMTMSYLIKDEKALREMRPGDQIKATLVVTDDGGEWLENVVITAKAGAGSSAKNEQANREDEL